MPENLEPEDQSQPVEASRGPLEVPEGLDIANVQSKAISWNAQWKTYFDVKKPVWESNYRLFRHFDKGLVENISARVYEVWANIQTQIPHLVNSIFTKSEIVKPIPRAQEPEDKALKIKNFINRMILVANQGRSNATDAIQDFLVFGTIVAKTFWDNERIAEFDLRPTIENPSTGKVEPNPTYQEWIAKYEGKPSSYNIDIFDFAIDPSFRGHDIQKVQWCRERMYFTKEELKEKIKSKEIIELSDDEITPGSNSTESGKDIRDRIDGNGNDKKAEGKAYVDEFWCTLYWDESGEQKSGKFWFWLLNDSRIIKFKKNVFERKPFIVSRCYRLTHEFFGIGDVDVMTALSENINVVHAQAGLLAKKTGQKLTLYTAAAGIDQQQIKRKEDGLLMVKDLNSIRTESTTAGADLGVLVNYKASLKGDLSNAVGVNDLLRGEDPGNTTATQISIMNSNSSARLALKLQNFQDEYIVSLASHFYALSKQFIDTYTLYIDNQMIQLSQEDFQGEYDWVPLGTVALANRNLRIQQMTDLAERLAAWSTASASSNGTISCPPFDLGKFVQNEILSLYEIPNADQYFSTPLSPVEAQALGNSALPIESANSQGIAQPTALNPSPLPPVVGNLEGGANSIVS